MGSPGSQPSRLQKWRPRPEILVNAFTGSTESGTILSVPFRVPIPDSRLRTKITVAFAFRADTPNAVDLSPGAASLWLAESDDDDSGQSGVTMFCGNIEGTEAAPTTVPATVGLVGYSREFVTAADNIEGLFTTKYNGFAGVWMLQLRYQPTTGQRFTPDEWQEICNLSKPQVQVPPAHF